MFLLDIDTMCETITHELIHYLQFNGDRYIPLNIDIEDNILTNEYLSFYDNYYGKENNIGDLLRIELEAKTFEYFPNFIRRYKANKIQFLISPQRTYTIQWICNNKSIPNYSESFSSLSPKQKIQIDFKTGLIKDLKKDFFSDNSDQN